LFTVDCYILGTGSNYANYTSKKVSGFIQRLYCL